VPGQSNVKELPRQTSPKADIDVKGIYGAVANRDLLDLAADRPRTHRSKILDVRGTSQDAEIASVNDVEANSSPSAHIIS
jgi:hypothetical protein